MLWSSGGIPRLLLSSCVSSWLVREVLNSALAPMRQTRARADLSISQTKRALAAFQKANSTVDANALGPEAFIFDDGFVDSASPFDFIKVFGALRGKVVGSSA